MSRAARAHRDAVHHFADSVAHLAPCEFAAQFVKPSHDGTPAKTYFAAMREDTSPEQLIRAEGQFDLAGEARCFAGILWPGVRTGIDLLDALQILLSSERWTFSRVEWGATHARPRDALLSLHWRTASGDLTSVMGFAPHGSMPVPRRAPYAAILFWPGGRCNEHERYKVARDRSTERTKEALEHAPEDYKRFRDVAFCLPKREVDIFMDAFERRPTRAGSLRRWWAARDP